MKFKPLKLFYSTNKSKSRFSASQFLVFLCHGVVILHIEKSFIVVFYEQAREIHVKSVSVSALL